ncbi:hypothetical protein [Advenella sp.]|uniref:hypothetical protein n=1 Tax=Advenella sp. TaxID=1872388 RepID=UPI00258F4E38|nr:hypothetical protein [Advenella sp.]
MEASIEELPSGNVQYLYEDVVVDGISVVDLNTPTPPNVTANYVDSSGKVYSNVLSKDEDGNYILKIGDSENSTYRTATLVEVNNLEDHLISQDGDLLIKTVNGRYPALHKRLPEPTVENGDATN